MKKIGLPGVPRGVDQDMFRFLSALKESIEVGTGRGETGDISVTRDYLESKGFAYKNEIQGSTPETVVNNTYQTDLLDGSVDTNSLATNSVSSDKIQEGAVTFDKIGFVLQSSLLEASWPVDSIFLTIRDEDPLTILGFGTWSQISEGKFLVGVDSAAIPDTDWDVAEETGGSKTHDHTLTGDSDVPDDDDTSTESVVISGNVGVPVGTSSVGSSSHGHTIGNHLHTDPVTGNTGLTQPTCAAPSANTSVGSSSHYHNATGSLLNADHKHDMGNHVHDLDTVTAATTTDSNVPPYFAVYMWKRTA